MNNKIVLQKIMSQYCPYDYESIRMDLKMKDHYVPTVYEHSFCNDICNTWSDVNCTDIHNDMFDPLKTGDDVLKVIYEAGYEDDEDETLDLLANNEDSDDESNSDNNETFRNI